MVKSSHKPAKRDLGFNESDAVVGVVGRRRVIQREEHAGGGLEDEQKQRHGAEHVNPAGATGNRLIEQGALNRFQVQTTVEPIIQP